MLRKWIILTTYAHNLTGESAMAIHAPLVTGSWICCVPRLIIAPQAFLKPMRPSSFKLPVNPDAVAVGIFSGNVKLHLNYFPNIIHDMEMLPPNTVHRIRIQRANLPDRDRSSDALPPPTAKLLGPVGILPALGVVLAAGLLILAIVQNDGAAVVALVLLSITSSLTGIGSLWKLQLQKRPASKRVIPMSDVLIRNTKGTFLVVHCDEAVARELYFTQEICYYRLEYKIFRICSGLATFAHMAGVIFLANCTWILQAAIGLAYIILNGSYWFGAVLPPQLAWNLEIFDVFWHADIDPATQLRINPRKKEPKSYTECLWEVAKITETMRWAKLSGTGIVPATQAWDEWVEKAEQNCVSNPDWEFAKALSECLKKYENDGKPHLVSGQTELMEPEPPAGGSGK